MRSPVGATLSRLPGSKFPFSDLRRALGTASEPGAVHKLPAHSLGGLALPSVLDAERSAMLIKRLPPVEELRRCLAYDAGIGGLVWIAPATPWSRVQIGSPAAYADSKYKRICIFNGRYLEHRAVWALVHGRDSEVQIDHINLDTFDNRIENLREASHGLNRANSRLSSNSTSGLKGVTWHKSARRWTAHIGVNGRKLSLGSFDNPDDAHRAYAEAARHHFGDFARTA